MLAARTSITNEGLHPCALCLESYLVLKGAIDPSGRSRADQCSIHQQAPKLGSLNETLHRTRSLILTKEIPQQSSPKVLSVGFGDSSGLQ